jgi:preprotein translocase subunit SecY
MARRPDHVAVIMLKRIAVNIAAAYMLVLMEAVPLWPGELAMLPLREQRVISAMSILSRGHVPEALHPFLLSVTPFIQVSILLSMSQALGVFSSLPPRWAMSREMLATASGQLRIQALGRVLGSSVALLMSLHFAFSMKAAQMCAAKDIVGISLALAAGSSMCIMLTDCITYFGLGDGVGFLYMVAIASGALFVLLACCVVCLEPLWLLRKLCCITYFGLSGSFAFL